MFTGTLIEDLIGVVAKAEDTIEVKRTDRRRSALDTYVLRTFVRTDVSGKPSRWSSVVMSVAAIAAAEQQNLFAPQSSPEPVRRQLGGTPEIYFAKSIDNSRIVKVADPAKRREMKLFTIALGVLFMLVMVYVWQHFSSIEYGYKIEDGKAQRDR